jgi:glutaconyl-CoA/methylmalonyl-CoA decarboxylase subunit gamma
MKYIITINNQNYEVEVEKGEARLLSVTTAAEPVMTAAPAVPAETPAVAAPAAAPAPAPAPVTAARPSGGDTLNAPMPGTIISIQKRIGDRVKSGDVVLILEAMKMENEIVAMSDGTITHILTSKGSVVSTGDPLVTIG